MPIKGLDQLSRKLNELKKVADALDGEIGGVSFDPYDPQSIELAIQDIEAALDEKAGSYRNNDIIEKLVLDMKEKYRQAILDQAAQARTEDESES